MAHSNAWLQAAWAVRDGLRAWRRQQHAQPEWSGQEEQTARFVAGTLRVIGYQPVDRVGGTHGLYADVGADGAPAAAPRADVDALPIREETGLPLASTRPGLMHACGRDAQTAPPLSAARLSACPAGA